MRAGSGWVGVCEDESGVLVFSHATFHLHQNLASYRVIMAVTVVPAYCRLLSRTRRSCVRTSGHSVELTTASFLRLPGQPAFICSGDRGYSIMICAPLRSSQLLTEPPPLATNRCDSPDTLRVRLVSVRPPCPLTIASWLISTLLRTVLLTSDLSKSSLPVLHRLSATVYCFYPTLSAQTMLTRSKSIALLSPVDKGL